MDSRSKKSNVVLLFLSQLVNYYLVKDLVILQQNYKHLSSVPNEAKKIIHKSPKVQDSLRSPQPSRRLRI